MSSSTMKKTSKIFKQMSELIGSRTPSQCRSHHQKFNPFALRGENGKRLPRSERSRAGRKKKMPQEKSKIPLYQSSTEPNFPQPKTFNPSMHFPFLRTLYLDLKIYKCS
jgi:hypothetical protein